MQIVIQEPTYWNLFFSKDSFIAYALLFASLFLWCLWVIWGDVTKKTLKFSLIVSTILPITILMVLNYVDYGSAKSSYNACFTNGQPKDNTKYVDEECLVKYDGYIKYNTQVK